jgi:hypothetical protein
VLLELESGVLELEVLVKLTAVLLLRLERLMKVLLLKLLKLLLKLLKLLTDEMVLLETVELLLEYSLLSFVCQSFCASAVYAECTKVVSLNSGPLWNSTSNCRVSPSAS